MTAMQAEVMIKLHGADLWASLDIPLRPASAPQGWQGDHPSLSRLAAAGGCVVDVGVWKGESTITLAKAIKANNINGCVVAVDTFLGSSEHYTNPMFANLFGKDNGRPDLYETFLSNVVHADVQDVVVPLPQTSLTAAAILKSLGIKPDLVHIDASHDYDDVLRDSDAYWDVMGSGGVMIGDDYSVNWPGVVRAAGEFSAKHLAPLTIDGPKWIVKKP